jgi:hypothetical protein
MTEQTAYSWIKAAFKSLEFTERFLVVRRNDVPPNTLGIDYFTKGYVVLDYNRQQRHYVVIGEGDTPIAAIADWICETDGLPINGATEGAKEKLDFAFKKMMGSKAE